MRFFYDDSWIISLESHKSHSQPQTGCTHLCVLSQSEPRSVDKWLWNLSSRSTDNRGDYCEMRGLMAKDIIRLECRQNATDHIDIFTVGPWNAVHVWVHIMSLFFIVISYGEKTQRDHYWICVSLMGSDINALWLAKITQFYWEQPQQFTILRRRRSSVLVFTISYFN